MGCAYRVSWSAIVDGDTKSRPWRHSDGHVVVAVDAQDAIARLIAWAVERKYTDIKVHQLNYLGEVIER